MDSIRAALSSGYRRLFPQSHKRLPRARPSYPSNALTKEHEETPTDPHIFFTLPPEIRHQIFRLLLAPKDTKGWIHTAILECSRRFHEDGTPILYCENVFKLEWFIGNRSLLQVWAPSSAKFELISRMTIPRNIHTERVNHLLPKFPSLWDVEIHLGGDSKKGAALLETVREQLEKIRRIVLVLIIILDEEHPLDLAKANPWDALRLEYSRGYGDVLDVPGGFLNRRMQVQWEPSRGMSTPLYGVARKMRLILEH